MSKQQIHTKLLGRKVKISGCFQPTGPQERLYQLNGQVGEIVNIYKVDNAVAYDILFDNGKIETMLWAWAFEVVPSGPPNITIVSADRPD